MDLFARNLNGSMSVGQAFAMAKSLYYGGLAAFGVYDIKSLEEGTYYGLPMYRFGTTGVIAAPATASSFSSASSARSFAAAGVTEPSNPSPRAGAPSVAALSTDADTSLPSKTISLSPF